MDVEKTIEFILDQQAKTETLWQRNEERWMRTEERWKRAEGRMERLEGRQERFEKSLEGVRKLIVMGMKTIAGVTHRKRPALPKSAKSEKTSGT